MIADIPSPPRTIMEVYKMLPEGTLAELINGHIYMSPAPNTNHQRISGKIEFLLREYVEKNSRGEVFDSPYDVYLDEKANAVQPDLIFISSKNSSIIKAHGIVGTPDLVVEFLSPGNNKHDLVTKKDLYEKFGVKEYWIIDPASKETIVYQQTEGNFAIAGKATATLFSPLFNHSFNF
jgi:Uma2 family endonuclease